MFGMYAYLFIHRSQGTCCVPRGPCQFAYSSADVRGYILSHLIALLFPAVAFGARGLLSLSRFPGLVILSAVT